MDLMDKVERVPMSELHLDAANARKGSVSAIVDSLKEFGQHRAVVAQRGTGRIIAGNHLFRAAQSLGWTEIGVYWVDDDDIKAVRRGIADNATGDLAEWDLPSLAELVAEVGEDIPGLDMCIFDEMEGAELDTEDEEKSPAAVYPIVAKFSESYHCAIVFATNDIDWAFIVTALQLERCKSYKNTNIGQSCVVPAEKFAQLWRSRGGGVMEGDLETATEDE